MYLIEQLNPEQQKAAEHVEGPMLVLAGAGSGKTRVVTFRIVRLLNLGIPAQEILALTFTNKAANEMKERIQHLAKAAVLACTFHSLGARILRESITALGFGRDFAIFDEEDSEKVLKECFADIHLKEERSILKEMRGAISRAKNQLISPDKIEKESDLFSQIYPLYQQKLKTYNAVDFDDLLFMTVQLFQEHPNVLQQYQKRWSFILIDEYQDTNHAQYLLTKLLSERHQNVFAVGDPDQSIYSWRGADIHNILNFERDFPGAKIVSLEQNYRSMTNILSAANAVIQNNTGRLEKNLWSQRGEGEKITLYFADDEHEEARYVVRQLMQQLRLKNWSLNDCALFYRTHFQSRVFEDALLREKIPYVIIGGISFYQRREIKDILALLRFALNGYDFLSFVRTINIPKRGFGESTLSKLRLLFQPQGNSLLSLLQEMLRDPQLLKLSQKQKDGLNEYLEMILRLREQMQGFPSLPDLIQSAISSSGYLAYLKEDPETAQEREENLRELVAKAAEWEEEVENPTLAAFLEELTLKTSQETKEATETLRLMTLHNSKGLEFPLVFIVGMEEELFPHANAKENAQAIEEERRLFYVGMTRARDKLYLTSARFRFLWGTARPMQPSRFLSEVPEEFLDVLSEETAAHPEELGTFAPGDHVYHRDFGRGIVQKSYQTSLGLTYDVFFPQADTTRSLVAKYAKLRSF